MAELLAMTALAYGSPNGDSVTESGQPVQLREVFAPVFAGAVEPGVSPETAAAGR